MKFPFLVFIFVLCIAKTNCQTSKFSPLTKEDYVKKSKAQKTGAWVTLGAGIGMVAGGLAINIGSDWIPENENKGLWLSYVGGVATLASIPLFISSHKNKKRAASLTVNHQSILLPKQGGWCFNRQPVVSLKIGW